MKKICEDCGIEFDCRRTTRKYCSKKCFWKVYYKKIKDSEKERGKKRRLDEKHQEYHKKYRKKNKEVLNRQIKEWRNKHLDRVTEINKKSNKKNKIRCYKTNKKWKVDNCEKVMAAKLARENINIPKGTLCEKCKIRKAKNRHHEDYNKPLEVKLLCVGCHRKIHNEKKLMQGSNLY